MKKLKAIASASLLALSLTCVSYQPTAWASGSDDPQGTGNNQGSSSSSENLISSIVQAIIDAITRAGS